LFCLSRWLGHVRAAALVSPVVTGPTEHKDFVRERS
jgi:hypothetical protein